MPPALLEFAVGTARVWFFREGDRWRHRVTTPAGSWDSLEDVGEDASDPAWPRSPALMEVSLVGSAILAVGQAGRSHFSLAVRGHRDQADSLLFEAACRIQRPAAWLGSTYLDPAGRTIRLPAAADPPPATVCWTYQIGSRGIEPVAGMAAAASC